jgi:SAM-dependent methyltransferase
MYPMEGEHAPTCVLKCGVCGLVYKDAHPDTGAQRTVYGEGYVHFTQGPPPSAADVNSARQKLRRSVELLGGPRSASKIRMLDIGCGEGQFVRILRELGYVAWGIDPFLPERLVGPLLRRAEPADEPAESVDVVTLLNVAEHVADPLALFASVRRLLKPGGVALITCPYGDSWAHRFYRNRWCHMALEEHLLFWTPASLERCLRRVGFEGGTSLRIAGSPFPFGLAAPVEFTKTAALAPDTTVVPAAASASLPMRIQRHAWQAARRIQAHEKLGNAVRALVGAARLGDYLEFAIQRDRPGNAPT